MSDRYARILATGAAAVLVAALGALATLSATFTPSPRQAITSP